MYSFQAFCHLYLLFYSHSILLCSHFFCFITPSWSICSGTLPQTGRRWGSLRHLGRYNETHLFYRHYPDNVSGLLALQGWQSRGTACTPPEGRGVFKIVISFKKINTRRVLLSSAHLDYVEFGKQVAVCQGEGVTVQVEASRLSGIRVFVQLMRERRL